uniref:DUF4795 domain-containing protein n=1 Tax=Mola mola TaxID=94237 RepID=A0A3Q3VRQ0_MOLML
MSEDITIKSYVEEQPEEVEPENTSEIDNLQNQLNELREMLDATNMSNETGDNQYEQLQETVNRLHQQQTKVSEDILRDVNKLVNDLQEAIRNLQAELYDLNETVRSQQEDNRQKQDQVEELYEMTAKLEENMAQFEIKADKSALDTVTEQFNTTLNELQNKMTCQEEDWHQTIDRFSTDMDLKLGRKEFDTVLKEKVESRFKAINSQLKAQAAEQDIAAGQVFGDFKCLSCDKRAKRMQGAQAERLPCFPPFPSHRSMSKTHNYEATNSKVKVKDQMSAALMYRNINLQEKPRRKCDASYQRLNAMESCDVSHTVNSTSQQRTRQQSMMHRVQIEMTQPKQDIFRMEGKRYNGPKIKDCKLQLSKKLAHRYLLCNPAGICGQEDYFTEEQMDRHVNILPPVHALPEHDDPERGWHYSCINVIL